MQDIKDRIIHLLEEIVERAHSINQQTSIHQEIEIDLVMEDIRLLYREFELLRRGEPLMVERKEDKHMPSAATVATPAETPVVFTGEEHPAEPTTEAEVEEPQPKAGKNQQGAAQAEISEPEPAPEPVKKVVVETPRHETGKKAEAVKPSPEPAKPKEVSQNGNRSVIDLFSQENPKSVGERLATEDNSLYRRIVAQKEDRSIGTRLQMTPISNLKDAIGVNEKFLFINELFGGNIQVYNESIARLNSFSDMQEAFEYLNELNELLGWDMGRSAQTIEKLANFVQRRYMAR